MSEPLPGTMFVKPAEGLKVRDPAHPTRAHIPAEGKRVPEDAYWIRRLQAGDVVAATPPAETGE
jgi:hypothetical protein